MRNYTITWILDIVRVCKYFVNNVSTLTFKKYFNNFNKYQLIYNKL